MIRKSIISSGDVELRHVQALRRYAAVPDETQDDILVHSLKRAFMAVQEEADKALLACRVRIEVTSVSAGDITRLYYGGGTVTDVKTSREGVAYEAVGSDIFWGGSADKAVIEYETEPNEGDVEDLLPVVLQYATALYDGQDSKTLLGILRQVASWN